MPKTRDIPIELKDFNKVFESIAQRHDSYEVFNHFLDFFINYFSLNHNIDLEYMRRKYSLEERHKFHQLIVEGIKVMDRMVKTEKDWYDIFGDYYQVLSSRSKASRFGQFFTPESLCQFSAAIMDVQDHMTVNEPSCGSGRFNLALHVKNQTLFHVAQDLDYMCVRMSALNFMMHGVVGVVICMDTLAMNPESFRGAFYVNRVLKYTGIPQIEYIGDWNRVWQIVGSKTKSKNTSKAIVDKPIVKVQEQPPLLVDKKTNQISMF